MLLSLGLGAAMAFINLRMWKYLVHRLLVSSRSVAAKEKLIPLFFTACFGLQSTQVGYAVWLGMLYLGKLFFLFGGLYSLLLFGGVGVVEWTLGYTSVLIGVALHGILIKKRHVESA